MYQNSSQSTPPLENSYSEDSRKKIKISINEGLDIIQTPKNETKNSQNKSERDSKKKSGKSAIHRSSCQREFEKIEREIKLIVSYQDSVITIASEILVKDLPEFIIKIHSDQAKNTRKRIGDKWFDYLLKKGIQLTKDTASSILIYNCLLNSEIKDQFLNTKYTNVNKRTKMLFEDVLEKNITCEELVCHFLEFLAEDDPRFIKNKLDDTINEVEILCEMMGLLLQSAGSLLYNTFKKLNSNKMTPVRIASFKIKKMCQTRVVFSLTTDCHESNKELVKLLNKTINETHQQPFEDLDKHSEYISEHNQMDTNESNLWLQVRDSNGFKEHNESFNDLSVEERKQQYCFDNGLSFDNRRKVESGVLYIYSDGQNGFNNSDDNSLNRRWLPFDDYCQKAKDNQSNLEEDDSESLKNNYNDTTNKNNNYSGINFGQINYHKEDSSYENEYDLPIRGYAQQSRDGWWNSLRETTNDNKNDITDKYSSLIIELTNKTKEVMQENDYIKKENNYIKKEIQDMKEILMTIIRGQRHLPSNYSSY